MPDAGTDIEAMDLTALQAELAAYKPALRRPWSRPQNGWRAAVRLGKARHAGALAWR